MKILGNMARKIYQSRFDKFILLGVFNYPLNIFLVWMGKEILGLHYLAAVSISYLLITAEGFFLNSYIFRVRSGRRALFKYIMALVFFNLLNILLVSFLTQILKVFYLLSAAASAAALFVIKFLVYKKFVFIHSRTGNRILQGTDKQGRLSILRDFQNIKAILFDVDGTLYNQSLIRLLMGWSLLFNTGSRRHTMWDRIRIVSQFRKDLEKLRCLESIADLEAEHLNLTASGLKIDIGIVKEVIEEWMHQRPVYWLKKIANQENVLFLGKLKRRGYRLGVFSDYPAEEKLEALGYPRDLFDFVLCGTDSEIKAFKPNPAGFVYALRLWGCKPEHLLYVGDRIDVDIKGAKSCGCQAILLKQSARRQLDENSVPIIRQLREIEKLLSFKYYSDNLNKWNSQINILPYLKVMRFDHCHKNIFVIAGVVVFFKLNLIPLTFALFLKLTAAALIVCVASSFNYIMNEIMDAKTDAFHPKKRHRPIPSGEVNKTILLVAAGFILFAALFFSYFFINFIFFVILILFFVFSYFYNMPPFRLKDTAYIDVMSESANSPIRVMLGWYAAGGNFLPPVSLLVAIWSLGCFLMTAKRYAEYEFISNSVDRVKYRKSYHKYTREALSTFMILWLMMFNLSFGIFIVRVEPALVVISPFLIVFFTWFWWLSHKPDSIVKEPERLFEEKRFFIYSVLLTVLFAVVFLFGSEIPLVRFIHYRYLSLR